MVHAKAVLGVVAITNTWILSGGLIYGWGPVHSLLLKEGQFRHDDCPVASSPSASHTDADEGANGNGKTPKKCHAFVPSSCCSKASPYGGAAQTTKPFCETAKGPAWLTAGRRRVKLKTT